MDFFYTAVFEKAHGRGKVLRVLKCGYIRYASSRFTGEGKVESHERMPGRYNISGESGNLVPVLAGKEAMAENDADIYRIVGPVYPSGKALAQVVLELDV